MFDLDFDDEDQEDFCEYCGNYVEDCSCPFIDEDEEE